MSAIKKINEDSRLRPFLSTLFDSESYTKNVIKEGRSEECFTNIVNSIEDINAEIKGYISQHKDNLMFGMQDVAVLAERYTNLSNSSQKLSSSIVRMKKEAMDAHHLVSSKTHELERIHETSIILHQLKQFASAKTQLDSYMKDGSQNDVRDLSSAAKTLSELEKLLQNPKLMEIKMVSDCATSIKLFGTNIRMLAQDRLLSAVADKNQAAIASSLQVFYNLDSLVEVVLMVVDHTVKNTVETSRDALDFELLSGLLSDTAGNSAPGSVSKRTAQTGAASTTISPSPQVSLAQLRIAIRELTHLWSSAVHDKATQIHVFQRVVAKKEDPASHEKFVDVLKRVGRTSTSSSGASHAAAQQYLVSGQLLELFWLRLAVAMQDVAIEKIKSHPLVASRSYPYLCRAAAEVVDNLQQWTEKDSLRDMGSNARSIVASSAFTDLASAASRDSRSMFGSLQWSQEDLLGTMDHSSRSRSFSTQQRAQHNRVTLGDEADNSVVAPREDYQLVAGLKPIRDRYLVSTLSKMNAPILQMFPEMEGYTAAVPSKRDLQTLIKAIQGELLIVVEESDVGLLAAVCREFQKVVKLMLSKIEGMISNGVETRKISSQNNFARTSQQEHNGTLLSLLMQFKEALEKVPAQLLRQSAQDSAAGSMLGASQQTDRTSGASGSLSAGSNEVVQEKMLQELDRAVKVAVEHIEDLAQRQILDSVVALLSGYSQDLLLKIHKEGVVSIPAAPTALKNSAASSGIDNGAESLSCSTAVQTLSKQLPIMLKAHIQSLVKCAVVDSAIEEICLRIMHSFVTIVALVRPVNELTRLRTAKDMTTLEMLLSGICAIPHQDQCPVVQEFRAFRRLLFQDDGKSDKSTAKASTNIPPNVAMLFQQDYAAHLRPSTLLGYYVSCAPAQLLSPYDVAPGHSLQGYVDDLTAINETGVDLRFKDKTFKGVFKHWGYSVRSLYKSNHQAWRKIENERRSWDIVQQCLDSFFQRIAVADTAQQKQLMRTWYEAILDLGSQFYESNGK